MLLALRGEETWFGFFPSFCSDNSCMPKPTPTNIHELVDQLVEYENRIKELTKLNGSLKEMNERARLVSVRMHTRATKQSSFTNYEVKQYAKQLTEVLTQLPLKK